MNEFQLRYYRDHETSESSVKRHFRPKRVFASFMVDNLNKLKISCHRLRIKEAPPRIKQRD
jgi:hypothetical protein